MDLLRLRIANGKAIVRELHVYGHSVKIGEKEVNAAQHTGLGKKLLEKAEEITRENEYQRIINNFRNWRQRILQKTRIQSRRILYDKKIIKCPHRDSNSGHGRERAAFLASEL